MQALKALLVAGAFASGMAMQAAHANIMFDPKNDPQPNEENVMFELQQTNDLTFTGDTNQTNSPVIFSVIPGAPAGELDIGTDAKGQADIVCNLGCNPFSTGGANGHQLTDLEIKPGTGFGWTDFVGNLDFGEGIAQIQVDDQLGHTFDYILGNGSNFFTLTATGGEVITDITIENAVPLTNFGFNDLKQPRVSGVCALVGTVCTAIEVPEPGTLSIAGFGLLFAVWLVRWERRKAGLVA